MIKARSVWTREAFIKSLSKHCLHCHKEGVLYTFEEIVREHDNAHVQCLVAVCTQCDAVYAQNPTDARNTYIGRFKCHKSDVVFVDTLPYHVPLGGEVGKILSEFGYGAGGTRLASV